jgi:hypothetical protein
MPAWLTRYPNPTTFVPTVRELALFRRLDIPLSHLGVGSESYVDVMLRLLHTA